MTDSNPQQAAPSSKAFLETETYSPSTIQHIDSGWKYKERSQDLQDLLDELADTSFSAWKSTTQFPSEIHAELVAADVIPHPYKAESDTDYQCEHGLTL